MSSSDGKNSDPERRTSVRTSTTSREDEEDYDMMSGAVADGFRPPAPGSDTTQISSAASTDSDSITQVAPSSATSNAGNPPQVPLRPSSVTKPSRVHDPLALRHDGAFSHVHSSRVSRTSSGSGSVDSPVMRSASPYQGPSGPSHPYQMYPQRTLSVATSTTAPVSERSYQGPQRPTHPYGLYTQTTESVPSGDATIGFGRPDNYERRIGPDGEEVADLIGPLGHTEALPPYTRYPEISYSAKPDSSSHLSETTQNTESSSSQPSPPSQPIPGAGGIGLATRNPEYESRDDLASPPSRSRLSTRSVTSDAVSQHEINTAAGAFNEKQSGNRWQKRAKKRMWGVIPVWAVCLVAAALLLM